MTSSSKTNKKIRVGVIFGGRSGEHEVSLMSAQSVIAALDRSATRLCQSASAKSGRWLTGDAHGPPCLPVPQGAQSGHAAARS